MADLTTTIAVYSNLAAAEADWDKVEATAKANGIQVADAALVEHDASGKTVTVRRQSRHGWAQGAVIGGLFAVVFPPSILIGAAAGAGIGEVSAKLSHKLASSAVHELGDAISEGEVALVAIVQDESAPELDVLLSGATRKVSHSISSKEDMQAAIAEASKHESGS